jgi:MatE
MMLSNILQSLFGTINNVYLGQMIGVDALAAVSVFFPVMFFFIAFVMGLSSGAGVLIGQAWGAGEPEKVKAVAGTTLTVALLLAGLIAILGGLFGRQLLVALATPPDILAAAVSYARIMMITMPLTFTFILMTALMRGVGDSVTPLRALAVSTVIGLAFTPALIRGWLGLPRLGVASAAWASAISSFFTLVWLNVHLRRRGHALAFDTTFVRAMRLDGALLRTILRLGIPAAIGMVVMSLAELVLLGLVNSFGSKATAAYGAVNQVNELYAVSGALDRDLGLDLRRAGDRARRFRAGRRHRPHRAGDEPASDRRAGHDRLSLLARAHEFLHHRRRGARPRAGAAPHRAVEFGAVRHVDGIFRGHARQRHGLDAAPDLDLCDHRDRGAVRDRSQPPSRHRGRLDRLSDHLLRHVPFADELLFAGLEKARHPASDLIRPRILVTVL